MMARRKDPISLGVFRGFGLAVVSADLTGCRRSPSINVLGSYFPGWLACMVVGVLAAVILQMYLGRRGWQRHLPLLPLFYLCVALLIACMAWLITFD